MATTTQKKQPAKPKPQAKAKPTIETVEREINLGFDVPERISSAQIMYCEKKLAILVEESSDSVGDGKRDFNSKEFKNSLSLSLVHSIAAGELVWTSFVLNYVLSRLAGGDPINPKKLWIDYFETRTRFGSSAERADYLARQKVNLDEFKERHAILTVKTVK